MLFVFLLLNQYHVDIFAFTLMEDSGQAFLIVVVGGEREKVKGERGEGPEGGGGQSMMSFTFCLLSGVWFPVFHGGR